MSNVDLHALRVRKAVGRGDLDRMVRALNDSRHGAGSKKKGWDQEWICGEVERIPADPESAYPTEQEERRKVALIYRGKTSGRIFGVVEYTEFRGYLNKRAPRYPEVTFFVSPVFSLAPEFPPEIETLDFNTFTADAHGVWMALDTIYHLTWQFLK